MQSQTLPAKSPQPALGLRTAAPCTCRPTVCKCRVGTNNFLNTAGERLCWGGREERGPGKERAGDAWTWKKRKRSSYEKRGRSTQRAPRSRAPAQHRPWAKAVQRYGHLWPPPPAAPAVAVAAPGVGSCCPEPRWRQGDLPGHTSDTPLWTSAILPNPAIWGGNGAFLDVSLLVSKAPVHGAWLTATCFRRSSEISVENERALQQEGDGANTEGPFSVALLPVRCHKTCCCLLAWISAPKGVKQNGLKLKILQSHGAIPRLPETIAVHEESVLSTEIQKYLLIKITTRSTARQFQDTWTVSMFSWFTWIFGERMNSLPAGTDIQLKTILMDRRTVRPCIPFQTAVRECRDVQVSGQLGIVIHQGNLKLSLALIWNQFFRPHSIKVRPLP